MHVPSEAIDAATRALREEGSETPLIDAMSAVDAAAPIISARAVERVLDALSWINIPEGSAHEGLEAAKDAARSVLGDYRYFIKESQ